jgi:6-phosphogluconolactonase/glucosamine-6-phosphate isomerase/deaminase
METFPKMKKSISAKNGISIIIVENPQEGVNAARDILRKEVNEQTLLFLSGGSQKILYEMLAQEGELDPSAVALIDERFGKKMHENSNEKMIKGTGFLSYFEEKKIPFYPILRLHPEGVISDIARDYNRKIKNLLKHFSKKIAIMGIGTDGHTAGIPPGNQKSSIRQAQDKNQEYVESTNNFPGEFKERITLTFKALSQMDLLIVLVFGSAKQNALVAMFKKDSLSEIPARFYLRPDIAKKTILITDQKI